MTYPAPGDCITALLRSKGIEVLPDILDAGVAIWLVEAVERASRQLRLSLSLYRADE
jgi:hypothetical protein